MQSLLQSAFLQALGYAIMNSLWQVALLWIVVMIVNSAGKFSSSKRYFSGVIAQFAGFIWFLFTLRFYYLQCSEVIANAQAADAANDGYYFYEPVVNNFSSGLVYVIIKVEQLLPYLSAAYIFMLLFLAARLTKAYIYTREIRTTGLIKPGVEWKLFVKKTAGYLGIRKNVTLYFSDLVQSPLTLGFLKPLILVPVASLNHLSPEQLEAVLLHELAHIKRADYLINIIQSVIEITLFFNPFTQLLGKLIKKERENSCDDWVLQFQYKPAMYAEALLRIAYIQTQPSFALQAAAGNKGELLPRVKRMLNQQEKNYQYRNHLFALLLITVMLTTVAWFNPAVNKKTNPVTTEASRKVLVEPLSSKVDNAFYNPLSLFTRTIQESIASAVNATTLKSAEVANQTADFIESFTPLAVESMNEVYAGFEKELPAIKEDTKKALQEAKLELANIKIDGVSITDSIALSVVLNNIVQKELGKIDWTKVNSDLQKARLELTSLSSNAGNEEEEQKINEALQEVNEQLRVFNDKKNVIDGAGLLKSLFEKKKQEIIKPQLQLKTKEEQEKNKQLRSIVRTIKPMRVWSDMKRDDYSYEMTEDAIAGITGNINRYEAPVTDYSQVAYYDGNIDFASGEAVAPDSAVIIVEHNPENDKRHTKNITIQVVANDGTVKTYTVTVDVYQ